jgi:antitoxin ParD1/3/4
MNVSLTPELERWVATKVEAGRYRSASEVVREGLRLLQEREEEHAARMTALRQDIRVGLDELDRGEGVDGEEVMDRIMARIGDREGSKP